MEIVGTGRRRDCLAALYRIVALDPHLSEVGVDGYPPVGVSDHDQVTVSLQFVAGIGDDAALDRVDRGAWRQEHVEAVARIAAHAGDEPAYRRPSEPRGRRSLRTE